MTSDLRARVADALETEWINGNLTSEAAERLAVTMVGLLADTPSDPAPAADGGEVEAHPHFTKFLEKALEDPEVRSAYEAANQRHKRSDAEQGETMVGPAVEPSQADRDRWALAELVTPNGFVLGDVIAKTILASDWLADLRRTERAEGAREALLAAAEEWQHHLRRDASLYDYGRWLDAAANMLRDRAEATR